MDTKSANPNSYIDSSVFTVRSVFDGSDRHFEVEPLAADMSPNDPSFDIAIGQFNDDGSPVDSSQLLAAENCVLRARTSKLNPNGAMVLVFVHGWHHDASWNRTTYTQPGDHDGDGHFHSFRLVLESFALREAERYADGGAMSGRRVVGIYLSWNGDPRGFPFKSVPVIEHATFWDRYQVAERIGNQTAFHQTLLRILQATKQAVDVPGDPEAYHRPTSPLVLIGHSMGALMLLSGYAAILEDQEQTEPRMLGAPVEFRIGETFVPSPDLIIVLNSAADSNIAKRIVATARRRSITKVAAAGGIKYSPPLLISVTSTADDDTGIFWTLAKPGRSTDGHDSTLFTHRCTVTAKSVVCQPLNTLDLGQNWHCLRPPEPSCIASPDFAIDLPARERNGLSDLAVPHHRYTISAISDKAQPHLMWVFQVPPDLIACHNDIFNSKARSLLLGLIQISGAVASIAKDWARNFEPF